MAGTQPRDVQVGNHNNDWPKGNRRKIPEIFASGGARFYYCNRYLKNYKKFNFRAKVNKWMHRLSQSCIAVLAPSSPLLTAIAAFKIDLGIIELHPVIAVGASLALGLLFGVSRIFRFEERWVAYRSVADSMRREEALCCLGHGEYRSKCEDERRSVFADRVEELIDWEFCLWARTQFSRPYDYYLVNRSLWIAQGSIARPSDENQPRKSPCEDDSRSERSTRDDTKEDAERKDTKC